MPVSDEFEEIVAQLDDRITRELAASMMVRLPAATVHYRPENWGRTMCNAWPATYTSTPATVTCQDCRAGANARGMWGVAPVPSDVCTDCGLATLPGFQRCYYCEQLWNLRTLDAASEQIAAVVADEPVLQTRTARTVVLGSGYAMLLTGAAVGAAGVSDWIAGALAAAGLLALANAPRRQ